PTAQIEAVDRAACCQHLLRQALLKPQLSNPRSNNIPWLCHAPNSELDTKLNYSSLCSEFGAYYGEVISRVHCSASMWFGFQNPLNRTKHKSLADNTMHGIGEP